MPPPDLISWLPPGLSAEAAVAVELRTRIPPHGEARWLCRRPAPGAWATAAAHLRAAGERLKRVPVARIVEAVDAAAARWGNRAWPPRLAARGSVMRATGFSAEAVDRSFDLELRNYRADSLWRTLRRELRHPACLDGPTRDPDLDGLTMAAGPDLVLAVCTGNVPGLPALSMVRALLVKAPAVVKVASGEPSFAAAFAATLHRALPLLGDCLLVTYWGRDERAVFDEVAAEADAVVAYGGVAAMRQLRAALPAGKRLIEHGHKLSVAYVSREYLAAKGGDEAARGLAADVAAFNQHACIAPQACFVQASGAELARFGETLARALDAEAVLCPLGRMPAGDAAGVRLSRQLYHWRSAARGAPQIWHAPDLEWTVVVDDGLDAPDAPGNRFLRLVPVAGFDAAVAQLRPHQAFLQNFGLACAEREFASACEALARLGVSRISDLGRMAEPSLMWRHDGNGTLGALVRWCDVEMHRGAGERRV